MRGFCVVFWPLQWLWMGPTGRRQLVRPAWIGRHCVTLRYNAEGVDGLRDRERPGRPALLAPELEEELRQLIEAGPDLERDGVVEYRVRHIRDLALRHFGVDYSRSGMQGRLHRMKLSYLKPRPIHPKADPAAQEAFKKTSPG
jgi:transposase